MTEKFTGEIKETHSKTTREPYVGYGEVLDPKTNEPNRGAAQENGVEGLSVEKNKSNGDADRGPASKNRAEGLSSGLNSGLKGMAP